MGITAAFLFSAQMVNFPIGGGLRAPDGGALAAILLGPFAGSVTLACVLVFQCLLFQDGGLTASALMYSIWRWGHTGRVCRFQGRDVYLQG